MVTPSLNARRKRFFAATDRILKAGLKEIDER